MRNKLAIAFVGLCLFAAAMTTSYAVQAVGNGPVPQATATTCGAAVGVTNGSVQVPVCPSPYPTPVPTSANAECSFSSYTLTCNVVSYPVVVATTLPTPTSSPTALPVVVGATKAVTVGTSSGPTNQWLITVQASLGFTNLYVGGSGGCIAGPSPTTTVSQVWVGKTGGTYSPAGIAPCGTNFNTLSSPLVGDAGITTTGAVPTYETLIFQGIYAQSATYTFGVYTACTSSCTGAFGGRFSIVAQPI